MGELHDLTGKKFFRWTVIEKAGNLKSGNATWLCKCDCGTTRIVIGSNLTRGLSKSCGCYNIEKATERIINTKNTKHGLYNTKLYKVFASMKGRCYNKRDKAYKNYGMRGIKICDEWLNDFMCFYNWSIENGYEEGLSIERLDVNGNYEPSNCKWITLHEQQFNKTDTHYLTYNNETKSIAEWSIETGIPYNTLRGRVRRGWSDEKSITTPVDKSKSNKKAGI